MTTIAEREAARAPDTGEVDLLPPRKIKFSDRVMSRIAIDRREAHLREKAKELSDEFAQLRTQIRAHCDKFGIKEWKTNASHR